MSVTALLPCWYQPPKVTLTYQLTAYNLILRKQDPSFFCCPMIAAWNLTLRELDPPFSAAP